MKLFISADLEGICGVTSPKQCFPELDGAAYERACQQLAKEVNCVVETAFEAGATAITVNDSHGYMTNLRLECLSPRVNLLVGKPKRCAMSTGLDRSHDAAIYIGYHAKAGTEEGILNHTFHSKLFDVRVNGVSYGEGGINALYASLVHQVPVILASGDRAFCLEISSLIPEIATVETKESLGFAAALGHPEQQVLSDYQLKTRQALLAKESWPQNLLTIQSPYLLEITFTQSVCADVVATLPWVTRVDGRTVSYCADDFQTLYQVLQSAYMMLSYTSFLE